MAISAFSDEDFLYKQQMFITCRRDYGIPEHDLPLWIQTRGACGVEALCLCFPHGHPAGCRFCQLREKGVDPA